MATIDRPFVALQRLLPARLLGAAVHRLAGVRTPWFKDWQIRTFARVYGIDTAEAGQPVPAGYPTLNAFFTRSLRPGARPVDPDPAAVTAPADGRIEQLGAITGGDLLQAKGHRYSLAALLACDAATAADYEGGAFVTVYLAPSDYHRVHMPLAGTIDRVVHVPGRRLAVNPRTVAAVPGLFAANERVVCTATHAGAPFAVVLVGALNVASISLAFTGDITGHRTRPTVILPAATRPGPVALANGDLLGQFNLGSTVVVALGRALAAAWRSDLAAGATVRVGARLGTLGTRG